MTTPTPIKETAVQRELREQREAQERYLAEQNADPQAKAMREALKLTKVEQDMLAKAEAVVSDAEAVVGRIVGQIQALQAGKHITQTFMTSDGRPLIKRLLDPKAKAREAAELPELRQDLEAARGVLGSAHRKRQTVLSAINAARMARRKAAKAKHAPKPPRVEPRGDWWSSMDRLQSDDAA